MDLEPEPEVFRGVISVLPPEPRGVYVFGTLRGKCKENLHGDELCPCKCYRHAQVRLNFVKKNVKFCVTSFNQGYDEGGPCLNCGHYPVFHEDNTDALHFQNPTIQNWVVTESDIHFEFLLGRGAFGEVWKGKLWGGDVAIKKLHAANHTQEALQDFTQEVSVLCSIRHPNCVLFLAATLSEPLCIVT